jgi:hypothetical protein
VAVAVAAGKATVVTLNVSSRAVDDSGWLQRDLVWTVVRVLL